MSGGAGRPSGRPPLDDARAGRSGVLVVRGEAGIGKSALLAYAASRAAGMTILRAVAVEAPNPSSRSRPCTRSSVHCWEQSTRSPVRKRPRCAPRSHSRTRRSATAFASRSVCSACLPTRPRSDPWSAWSTTRSGSTALRQTHFSSPRDGSRRSPWPCSSRPGTTIHARTLRRACPSFGCRPLLASRRASCLSNDLARRRPRPPSSGWSTTQTAIRSPSSKCLGRPRPCSSAGRSRSWARCPRQHRWNRRTSSESSGCRRRRVRCS